MHLHNAIILHAGNRNMTIHKGNLTAPEIVLLRKIHGEDAVLNIEAVAETNRPIAGEYDRLVGLYGREVVVEAFPGAITSLPKTLAEAGIDPRGPVEPTAEEKVEETIVPLPSSAPALPPSIAKKLAARSDALV